MKKNESARVDRSKIAKRRLGSRSFRPLGLTELDQVAGGTEEPPISRALEGDGSGY